MVYESAINSPYTEFISKGEFYTVSTMLPLRVLSILNCRKTWLDNNGKIFVYNYIILYLFYFLRNLILIFNFFFS